MLIIKLEKSFVSALIMIDFSLLHLYIIQQHSFYYEEVHTFDYAMTS
jgi:hypothetical protein